MKKMIKSYKFWTALAGALGLLAVSIAKIFGFTISSAVIEDAIMALCGVLVVLGIVQKPKNSTNNNVINDAEIENLNMLQNAENIEEQTENLNQNLEE